MAQRQNVQVNLQFTADTGKARAQLQELQTSLQRLIVSSAQQSNFGINKELQEASKSAAQLQYQLEKATNVQTGKLDLGKFSESLKQSGKTLKQYQQDLSKLGAAGDAAFEQLAQSVMSAEMPLKRTNKMLDEFWSNLKKTAGWTISSSIINSFQGALQKAYGYAQDLNKSLNDIRIVTGYSTNQMADFAKNANAAAKALSTTTTNYTNASLIYYQQGLTDQEVIDRTNVTVKMANAAGVSAEEVSQQLTAVWNNFYDGSKSLEYYADVMTALGAATASSTDEISEGLEKFASVADTIGLSYEYATASLATITATTRESANVVGTALKTLFSRIQGLSLGETLDDGTDLNKYSDALNKVGISIFDQNHQLKEMDDILDEMGNKWDTLAQDQKMALAQTVAGVRQYTQLITLMDNWDYFQENLGVATGATGALDTQADIYAESWEAANKRIQASAESIYDALLNDEFFVKLTNFGADALDTIKEIIDSMGGVEGVLLTVGAIATRVLNKQMAQGLRDTAYQIRYLIGAADKDAINTKRDAGKLVAGLYDTGGDSESYGANAINSAEKSRLQAQLIYLDKAKELSEEERRIAEFIFDQQQSSLTTAKNIDEQVESEEEKLRVYQEELRLSHQIEQSRDKTQYNASQQILDDFMTGDYDHLMSTNSIAEFQSFKQLMEDGGILSVFEADESIINSFKEFSNLLNLSGTEDNVEEVRLAYEKLYKTLQTSIGSETLNYSQFMMDNGLTSQARDFQDKKKQNRIANVISSRMKSRKEQGDFGETDKNQIELYIKQLKDLSQVSDKVKNEIQQVEEALSKGDYSAVNTSLTTLITKLQDSGQAFDELEKEAEEARKTIVAVLNSKGFNEAEINEMLNTMAKSADTVGIKVGQLWTKTADAEAAKEGISNLRHTAKADLADLATSFTSLGFSIGSTTTSIFSLVESFRDGQPTVEDFMSALMVGGQITETVGSLKGAHKTLTTFAGGLGKTGIAAKVAGMNLVAFTGYIAAAVAVIAGLVIAFKAIYNNSPEGKLKAAAESAQLASQEADRLSQAYKEVNSQLDALEDKTKSIEEMTRGTYEWRSAIMETNDEVIQLLQSYDLLKEGMYEINADGLYSFTEAGKEEINRIAFERQQQAINNKYTSKLALNEAELNVAFNRPGDWGNITNENIVSAIQSGTLTATQESVRKFLDFTDAYEFNSGNTSGLDNSGLDLYENYFDEDLNVDYLIETIEAVTKVLEENNVENVNLTKELARNNFGEKLETLELQNGEKDTFEYILGKVYDKALNDADSGFNGLNRTKVIAQEYSKLTGYNFTKNNDGSYSFWQNSPDNIVATMDREALLKAVVQEQGKVPKDTVYAEAEELFERLKSVGETINVGNALTTFAYSQGGDFSSLTQDQIQKIDASKILGELGSELAGKLGINEENINLAKQAAENSFRQLKTEIPSFMKDAFNSPNLTLDTAKNLQNLLNESLTNNYDSFDGFNSVIKEIANNADTETLNNFVNVLSTIDKDSLTIESLNTALIKAGVETNIFNGKLDELVKGLKKSAENLTIEQAHELNNILKKTLESGAIDEKSLEILKQQNIGLETFFTLMGDGMYHLTGDVQKFYDLVNNRVDTVENDLLIAQQEYDKIAKYQKKESLNIDEQLDILSSAGIITDEERNKLQANRGKGTTAERQEANREITELFENNKEYLLSDSFLDTLAARVETSLTNLVAVNGLEGLDELDSPLKGIKDKSQVINAAVLSDLQKNDLNIDLKQYQAYRKELIKNNEALDEQSILTNKLAIQQIKFENGVKDLTGSWESYNEIMSDSNATALQKAEILPEIDKALMQILNLDESTYADLDEQANGFAEKYWTSIQEAVASGNYEPLQKIAFEEFAQGFKTEIGTISPEFDFSKLYDLSQQLKNSDILSFDGDLKVDTSQVDEATIAIAQQFSTLLQSLYQESGESIEAISGLLTKMGFSIEYEYETKDFFATKDAFDEGIPTSQIQVIKGFKIVRGDSSTDGNYTPEVSGGGGGSGPSEYKKTSKDEVLDRYKEEDDRLDDINDALDDYNRLMDRSYGQGRLNQMAKLKKALAEEKKAIEDKKAKALEYLQVDKEALEQAAKQHGVDFNIDDNGNITNYTETMENLFKQLEAAEAKANSFTSKEAQDKYIEASITPIKTKIEELKEVIVQYEETRELIEDLENEWEEVRDKEYANNYAELSYKIELRVELNEMDMDLIEYRIAQLGEGFFKSEEILALMGGDKLNNLTDGLKVQQDAFNDLQSAIEKDEITQADYVEGLKEAYQSTMDLANAVLDLDKEMLEYYSNTLDKANEELDKYTNNLEHLTGVLDHYKNIMGIIGKETDYEAMGKIMDARVITTRNELDIAKKNYAMMAEEVDKWAAKMNEATGEKELELYTKNWEAANEKMQEAQEEMLSKTEAWAEAMREQIENALNLENRNLEKILTGEFGNFDSLITSMDRAQSLQDNYLTETNKIYELDKLVNKAQQEIDKTNNQIAKQKLKAYMEETEELENVNQLSKYNLEIQQAKLDLVLAEIALEEAQNAKSVVRLSRDSEGNYGYVYTADQNKVSQAEQDFADAQNNLYNIGLRGSTEFAEKYAQTLQEMYDTLGQLQEQFLNGEFENEKQYNEAVASAKQFYFAQLKAFQDDYTLSFTTHDQVRTDSWGTSYETMIDSTQEWEDAVNQNIENVSDQFSLWEELSTEASENIKEGLDEVTESSEALADQIEDEILPAIEDEIDLVGDLTAEYAELRDELIGAANDYLELAEAIREALAAEQNKDRYEKSQKDAESVKDKETGGTTTTGGNPGDGDVPKGQGPNLTGNPDTTTPKKYNLATPVFLHSDELVGIDQVSLWNDYYAVAKRYNEMVDNGVRGDSLNTQKKKVEALKNLLNSYGITFDTGGYTGVWGSDGRWALLHQKELVLNQDDTSNILSAVGIIRHIIDSIDLQSAYQRLAAPSASFFGAVSGGQAIDQNVSIEATFPNVQDRHEIEEAFNNLINTASQYAFRK